MSLFRTSRTKKVIHFSSSVGVIVSSGEIALPQVLLRCLHHSLQTLMQYCVSLCVFFGTASSLLEIMSISVTGVANLFVVGEGVGGGGSVVTRGAELVALYGGVIVGGGGGVAIAFSLGTAVVGSMSAALESWQNPQL